MEISYGAHHDQVIDLYGSAEPDALYVVIHGGYWRANIDRTSTAPLAESLANNSTCVANIEYRRGAEHRWPMPLRDVTDAITLLRETFPGVPVYLIGHSVGGQLALLCAQHADAVIALAPVTDVHRCFVEELGDQAVAEYFGKNPDPARLEDASPIYRVPAATPVLLVHGHADERVPLTHSGAYLSTVAGATFAPVEMMIVDSDHFQLATPEHTVWADIHEWLVALSRAAVA